MFDKEHALLCIMAESAAGKDKLINEMCKRNNLNQLTSYTTRQRRNNEGNTHIFVNEDAYNKMKENGVIAAYTYINGNHYWSTVDQLYESDFYCIDYLGIEYMKSANVDLSDFRFVTIFINTPKYIREQRALNSRNDDALTFYKRCFNEDIQLKEMLLKNDFDYAVSNVDFDKAYKIFKHIVETELNK